MADKKVTMNHVESCNLGRFGSDGVALRINFATNPDNIKEGPYRHVVFGLSHELATGLAKALEALLAETTKPTKN